VHLGHASAGRGCGLRTPTRQTGARLHASVKLHGRATPWPDRLRPHGAGGDPNCGYRLRSGCHSDRKVRQSFFRNSDTESVPVFACDRTPAQHDCDDASTLRLERGVDLPAPRDADSCSRPCQPKVRPTSTRLPSPAPGLPSPIQSRRNSPHTPQAHRPHQLMAAGALDRVALGDPKPNGWDHAFRRYIRRRRRLRR
jgi:hypothetical protein